MLGAVIIISVIFILLGFLITENNAKYLLSGYSTLPTIEQEKVEIKPYLKYFKRFCIFFGASSFLVGMLLLYVNNNWVMPYLIIYPVLASIYFSWTSKKYFSKLKNSKTRTLFAFIILGGSLLLVLGLFIKGNSEDQLLLKNDRLIIEGFYGEEIPFVELDSFALIANLPQITKRTNGYAAGAFRKGYFETKDKKRVKLVLHSWDNSFMFIKTKGNRAIYYSVDKEKNKELFEEINAAIKKQSISE